MDTLREFMNSPVTGNAVQRWNVLPWEVGAPPSRGLFKYQSYQELVVMPRRGQETGFVTLRNPSYLRSLGIGKYREKPVAAAGRI